MAHMEVGHSVPISYIITYYLQHSQLKKKKKHENQIYEDQILVCYIEANPKRFRNGLFQTLVSVSF